ncbi:MAG: hypothetical protein OXL33_01225 [Chloroflexota bacterium]|nr:hypothetical protein [Chloroflexota bacterium]
MLGGNCRSDAGRDGPAKDGTGLGFFGNQPRDDALYIYVEIDRTQEIVTLRVDLNNDLTQEFAPGSSHDSPTHYTCTKQVMGEQTFRPAQVWLQFDSRRRMVDSKVEGGRLVAEEELLDPTDADSDGD